MTTNSPGTFQNNDFRQSVVNLREKLNALLKPIKQCADVVDRINELKNLHDCEQFALPNPYIKLSPEETELVTHRKQQIDDWQKEIDVLYKPFPGTEREIYSFLGELQRILNALPVEPPQLRDIRSEIERLDIWAAARSRCPYMGPGYADLQIVDRRLMEMLVHLAPEKKPIGFEGLKQKKQDLSRYLDAADLTQRQNQCLSMKLEYELSYRNIGQRLGISQSTVDEHIRSGTAKLNRRGFKPKVIRSSNEEIE